MGCCLQAVSGPLGVLSEGRGAGAQACSEERREERVALLHTAVPWLQNGHSPPTPRLPGAPLPLLLVSGGEEEQCSDPSLPYPAGTVR